VLTASVTQHFLLGLPSPCLFPFCASPPPCRTFRDVCSIRNVFGGPLNAHEHDYTSAHGVHRSIPVLLATVSLLFLEAALILNGRPAVLTRPIRGLSDTDLCPWLVHAGTAQED